jgi:hypothetical protein
MNRRAGQVRRLLLSRVIAERAVGVIVGGAVLALGGRVAWEAYETWGTPTCSWPLQVRGTVSPAQAGLVRCYLRALASRDAAGLKAVADYIPPIRITTADLAHSADASAGLATATFTQNPNDTSSAFVDISYADGAREDGLGLINMNAMGGPSGWRMAIGMDINPGPSGPPPAEPSPSS